MMHIKYQAVVISDKFLLFYYYYHALQFMYNKVIVQQNKWMDKCFSDY